MIGSVCQLHTIAASVSGCVADALSAFNRIRHCNCKVTVELCGGDVFAAAGLTGSATKFRSSRDLHLAGAQYLEPKFDFASDLSVLGLRSIKEPMNTIQTTALQ